MRNLSSEIGGSFSMGAVSGGDVFLYSSGETKTGRQDELEIVVALVLSLELV